MRVAMQCKQCISENGTPVKFHIWKIFRWNPDGKGESDSFGEKWVETSTQIEP